MLQNQRGQVSAEIAVLFTFVIAAFIFMGLYIQRGAQGGIKGNADSLGQQFSTNTEWSSITKSKSHQAGAVTESSSCSDYEHVMAEFGEEKTGAPGIGVVTCTSPTPASFTAPD